MSISEKSLRRERNPQPSRVLKLAMSILLVVGVTAESATPAQAAPTTYDGGRDELQALGLSIDIPRGAIIKLSESLSPIPVVQIFGVEEKDVSRSVRAKVEVAVERLMNDMNYDEWREIQARIGRSYDAIVLESKPIIVDSNPGIQNRIRANSVEIIEVEVPVKKTVYRVSAQTNPQAASLFDFVLGHIHLAGADHLAPNEIPAVYRAQHVPSKLFEYSPSGLPELKFPFNGTKTIKCAYYADDSDCHNKSKIALDFNLNYETVRAAHSGNLVRIYESCGGNKAVVTYDGDLYS